MKKRQMRKEAHRMSRQSSQEKIAAVKTLFEAHQDAEQAESMSRYMRDQFPFYGIPAP